MSTHDLQPVQGSSAQAENDRPPTNNKKVRRREKARQKKLQQAALENDADADDGNDTTAPQAQLDAPLASPPAPSQQGSEPGASDAEGEDKQSVDLAAGASQPSKKGKKKRKQQQQQAHEDAPAERSSGISRDKIWSTNNEEERERIKQFWVTLSDKERRSLVRVEKDAILRKMKEQQKHTCSCSVCGRKRVAIEEELEGLYDAYYRELEHHAQPDGTPVMPSPRAPPQRLHTVAVRPAQQRYNTPRAPPDDGSDARSDEAIAGDDGSGSYDYDDDAAYEAQMSSVDSDVADFLAFGSSLRVKGGILTVADDLLKNDGKRFIEMMENLASRRMRAEESETNAAYSTPGHYLAPPANSAYGPLPPHSHVPPPPPPEEEYDDEDDGDESGDDGDYPDEEEEEEEYEEDEELSEEQRLEEGRRMFQIFAARMFEQRVLTAYKERVAFERQQQLLEELEAENRQTSEQKAKKAKEALKKKEKAALRKKAAADAKARKEEAKAAEDARLKAEGEQRKEEEIRKRDEKRRLREEAAKREEALKEAARLQRKRAQEEEQERKARQAREAREAREAKEQERKLREQQDQERREEAARAKENKEADERAKQQERDRERERERERERQQIQREREREAQAKTEREREAKEKADQEREAKEKAARDAARDAEKAKQDERAAQRTAAMAATAAAAALGVGANAGPASQVVAGGGSTNGINGSPAVAPGSSSTGNSTARKPSVQPTVAAAIPHHLPTQTPASYAHSPKITVATPVMPKAVLPRPRTTSQQVAAMPTTVSNTVTSPLAPTSAPQSASPYPGAAAATAAATSQNQPPHPITPVESSPGPAAGLLRKSSNSSNAPPFASHGGSPMGGHMSMQHQAHLANQMAMGQMAFPNHQALGIPPPVQRQMSTGSENHYHNQNFYRGAPPGLVPMTMAPGLAPSVANRGFGNSNNVAPPPGFSAPAGFSAPVDGFSPMGGMMGQGPMPDRSPQPHSHSHSRQVSMSFENPQGTPRPLHIRRPTSVVHPSSPYRSNTMGPTDDFQMDQQLGISALLDGSEEDSIDLAIPRHRQATTMHHQQYAQASPFMDPIATLGTSAPWSMSAPVYSSPAAYPPHSTWDRTPQLMASNLVAAIHPAPTMSRPQEVRTRLCRICSEMLHTGEATPDGCLDFPQVLRRVQELEPAMTEENLMAFCETEGNDTNGGGTFEVVKNVLGTGRTLIRWTSDTDLHHNGTSVSPFVHRAVGTPGDMHGHHHGHGHVGPIGTSTTTAPVTTARTSA